MGSTKFAPVTQLRLTNHQPLLCGLKLSSFGLILSAWGIIQLSLTGLFFQFRAVALVEDVPLERDPNPDILYQRLEVGYQQNAVNCWVAALLYFVTFCVSAQQYWMNKRVEEIPSEQFY